MRCERRGRAALAARTELFRHLRPERRLGRMAANSPVIGRILLLAARVALGGLFIYAGVSKALDPTRFAEDIGHYRLVPHAFTVGLAMYLPWLEIICGGAVVAHWRYRGALSLLGALCGIFALALG